jgi:hypothetical protein
MLAMWGFMLASGNSPKRGRNGLCGACDNTPGSLAGPISAGVKGKVLLVLRGDCYFITKLQAAFEAGATAVIVYNNVGNEKLYMGSPEGMLPPVQEISEVIISTEDGELLVAQLLVGGCCR